MPSSAPAEHPTQPGVAPRRRFIFAVCCGAMLALAMAGQILPAVLAPAGREFARDLSERGLLLGLAPAGFIISTLLSGWLSDRWGQRVFILIGLASLAMGLALAAWAPAYPLFAAGMLIIGTSAGLVESPASAVGADAFPDRSAQMLNLMQMFFNVGAILGPAAVSLLLGLGGGWRSAFGVVAAVSVLTLAVAHKGLPAHRSGHALSAHPDTREPIRYGLVLALALALFLYVGAEMTIAQWSANYVEATFGVVSARAALVVSGFWLAMMLGRGAYVFLVGRWGYLPLVLASAILSCLAAASAAVTRSGLVASLACCAAGFFLGGSWPTLLGYAASRQPGRTGVVFGVIVSAGSAGAVLVPPLGGWLAQHSSHGLRSAMMLGAAVVLLEGIVILALWLRDRDERTD